MSESTETYEIGDIVEVTLPQSHVMWETGIVAETDPDLLVNMVYRPFHVNCSDDRYRARRCGK